MKTIRTTKHVLLVASSIVLWPLAASAGEQTAYGGLSATAERTVDVSLVALLPPVGAVGEELTLEIRAALLDEAAALGWRSVGEDEIRAALAGRERLASPDLIEIGRVLGCGQVVATELSDLGGEIDIKLRVLATFENPSAVQLRVATRETAAAEARLGLAAALQRAPVAALVLVPPPPVAHRPLPQPLTVVTLPPGYVLVAPGVIAAPAPSPHGYQAPPPDRNVKVISEADARRRDNRRAAGVFGITTGVQAGALYLSMMIVLFQYELDLSPSEWKTTAIVYSAVAPALSGLGAWGIGNRSRTSTISYPALLGGTYAGSAINLGILLATFDNRGDSWFFTWVMGPILLPAIGATIAYAVGRESVVEGSETAARGGAIAMARGRASWSLPGPAIIPATDGSRRLSPGVSLGTLTF